MLIPDYKALWASMTVNSDRTNLVRLTSSHIKQFQTRYQAVGDKVCPSIPVPWYFIGLIHHMESGQNFNCHLYNGDPLDERTVHVPKGRPLTGTPPFTWDFSAQDALTMMGFSTPKIWEVNDVLARLEMYNGLGYRTHDIYTPYVWSGTNHYQKGKYTSDGKYDPNNVSTQLGCAPVLQALLLM